MAQLLSRQNKTANSGPTRSSWVQSADGFVSTSSANHAKKTYILGFTFVPSTTLAVNKLSEFNEHLDPALHPIYFADFGHLGGPNEGVYGAAGRLDARREPPLVSECRPHVFRQRVRHHMGSALGY